MNICSAVSRVGGSPGRITRYMSISASSVITSYSIHYTKLYDSGELKSKVELLEATKLLQKKGYEIYATRGSQRFFEENGIAATAVQWPDEEGEFNVKRMLSEKTFDLVINIPKNTTERVV